MLKMLPRPSQKLVKVLIVVILVLNIGYFSSNYFYNEDTLSRFTAAYTGKDGSNTASPSSPIPGTSGSGPESKASASGFDYLGNFKGAFGKKLKSRFMKVEENVGNKYWLAKTGLTETKVSLFIKSFLKDSPDKKFESGQSWLNKNEIFYDPRFTLSIYLNSIKNHYLQVQKATTHPVKPLDEKNSNNNKPTRDADGANQDIEAYDDNGNLVPKADVNKLGAITLPFNWIDWLDLTPLNEDLAKPMKIRMTCDDLRKGTNNNPNPDYFCIDNKQLSDDDVKNMGFKNRNQLPGFIIHSHSSHNDRPFNDLRVIEAKSYGYTQHLPKPLKVIILTDEGGTFEFNVDEGNNQRLITSDLIHEYMKNNKNNLQLNMEEITDNTIVNFDPIVEYQELVQAVSPKTLSDAEDVNEMYRTLKKQTSSTNSKEVKLTESMFHYSRQVMLDQIDHYESDKKAINRLSANERMYYNSLKYCSQFEKPDDEKTYFKLATIRIDDDKNKDKEWGWHYDWRFFNGALNYDRVGWNEKEMNYRANIILDRLLRSWNRFAEEKGIISWLMHGPLLSWYWNGLMFPFDLDIDIQMPMTDLIRLAKDYNQTLVVEDPMEGYGKFLIDVGTFIHNRDISTRSNHIDARFVDVDSGIYIDITALANSKANPPGEYKDKALVDIEKPKDDDKAEIYNDRRKHFYKLHELSPLRYSMIEGVPVFIPSTITNRLIFEYPKGLSSKEYKGWYFVDKLNLWVKQDQIGRIFDDKSVKKDDGKYDSKKLLEQISQMSDDDVIRLLDSDDELLIEYYLSKPLTDFHDLENLYLFDENGNDNENLAKDPKLKKKYNELVSHFRMFKPMRKALWDYENLERKKFHIA